MRNRSVALVMAVALLTAALPQTARAGDPYLAAYHYEKCMDRAEAAWELCQDLTDPEFGEVCLSAYGYAKLFCTLKYGYDLIKKD
jgi:hypothetical protein